jgi:hypothetical protein
VKKEDLPDAIAGRCSCRPIEKQIISFENSIKSVLNLARLVSGSEPHRQGESGRGTGRTSPVASFQSAKPVCESREKRFG